MKNLRFLLIPFSLLYSFITLIRNFFFDIGIFASKKYRLSSIGVGNLSMGGTGKSILVDYLILNFKTKYNLATLSRGSGRSTKGFLIAEKKSLAFEVGDEPFQFLNNHPEIKVTVCENRRKGVEKIQKKLPKINLIIFDDLMQHRWVKSDVLIVTTSFCKPFFKDYVFPFGKLRENRSGIKRADIVLVTSTPKNISDDEKNRFLNNFRIFYSKRVFFTTLKYSSYILNFNEKISTEVLATQSFLLVTGIADTTNFVEYLKLNEYSFEHLKFSDHHNYSTHDCELINRRGKGKIILTTEKDFGRLAQKLNSPRLYYITVSLNFLDEKDSQVFNALINKKLFSK